MSRKTVFIVDDNDAFRTSIAWMLRGEGHQTIEFGSASKAISALRIADASELQNSCLLIDVHMPGMSGPEFHETVKREQIPVPIVYMTGHADVAMVVDVMQKGAVSLLEKPLQVDLLNHALNTAFDSGLMTGASNHRSAGTSQYTARQQEFAAKLARLTPRERQVMNGIVDGKANKLIAHEFGISVRTVEVHRARLMKKLATRSVSELVKMVLTSCPS